MHCNCSKQHNNALKFRVWTCTKLQKYGLHHKNMGVIRSIFHKCPYIRACPYIYGRLSHTAYIDKTKAKHQRRLSQKMAALLNSLASPNLDRPGQWRRASPHQSRSPPPQLSPNLLLPCQRWPLPCLFSQGLGNVAEISGRLHPQHDQIHPFPVLWTKAFPLPLLSKISVAIFLDCPPETLLFACKTF